MTTATSIEATAKKAKPTCFACGDPATVVQIDEQPVEPKLPYADVDLQLISFADIPETKSSEQWKIACKRCGSKDPFYWFELSRIRTPRQALSWTMHLSGKNWFSNSIASWRDTMVLLFPGVEDAS